VYTYTYSTVRTWDLTVSENMSWNRAIGSSHQVQVLQDSLISHLYKGRGICLPTGTPLAPQEGFCPLQLTEISASQEGKYWNFEVYNQTNPNPQRTKTICLGSIGCLFFLFATSRLVRPGLTLLSMDAVCELQSYSAAGRRVILLM
jgi:hypothetical protein